MREKIISYDPSNGEAVGEVKKNTLSDISQKVANAKMAQKEWAMYSPEERVKFFSSIAAEISAKSEELTELLCQEMGKDYHRASGEVQGAGYGAVRLAEQVRNAIKPKKEMGTTIKYVPLGVVAVISPWNYPLMMAVNLITPALIAGNAVVFKPSEETPLIAQAYFDILSKYLPKNVIQIVHGDGEQGRALVESDVNMIAFTGSQVVGKDIMKRAASNIKRLVMELGGNDPMIVLEDADIEQAARFAVASSFENAGQMCTSTERIYVDEKVVQEFQNEVVAIASNYKYGPWNASNINYGPIINEKQRDKIIAHIKDAKVKGAKVLLGGENHPERYIVPTVIAEVNDTMLLEQEETFGPVVSIDSFSTVKEAITRSNNSTYGLGAVVFGEQNAAYVAEQLEAGMVGVNKGPGSGYGPWVGAKQSGFGYHGTVSGHRQFTQTKVIN
ncbi:aldehyde dehydrogenase family protein [Flammeovirga sp. SubArs3]|uniref:aldehyde dehydrogenase family protein n=1 Tax=Flammeovirga sp. SubArs3 TaxID=2995316 RepID=UPI00248D0735|nr:aldehyde dehydrogenase family protein [Flammeovirga sp. SubArs3]